MVTEQLNRVQELLSTSDTYKVIKTFSIEKIVWITRNKTNNSWSSFTTKLCACSSNERFEESRVNNIRAEIIGM